MRKTKRLQENRKMRFEEAYDGWNAGRLTQGEAAQLLGMCERSFRRNLARYEAEGRDGVIDWRLERVSSRRAPMDEGVALTEQYRSRHRGWNVKPFHGWYRRDGGTRSYTWVKKCLQEARLVPKAEKRGAHRKRRKRSALPGRMIHQDGSTHEWVAGQKWDLIVTLDDATSEHYSMVFVDEEGTASSFRGARCDAARGLFSSFYSDRGSPYWTTPEARGRSERVLGTHQGAFATGIGAGWQPTWRLPTVLPARALSARVRVNRYANGALALFHGPRGLAYFTPDGRPTTEDLQQVA